MIENLVIVESPAKAKTIERFLGSDYIVKSSFGHIRDLEKKDLGIDITNNFQPKYEISADKKTIVSELKKLAKEAKTVWLASDEDREGEAIAWHLFEVLNLKPENTKRIVFHEITKDAILNAIRNPRDIDRNLVDAQQARRVLDRLVGFEVSPVLWKKVKPALSAGRVQSVAVKLIVEREREINAFKEQQYYRVIGIFETTGSEKAQLKAEASETFKTKAETLKFLEACRETMFSVSHVETKPLTRKPAPPFTTSTLQQEASRKLGFSVSQTMSVAQKLYEHGHITYMRTDSVNLSDLAIRAAKAEICQLLGEKYSKSRNYSTKTKGAQEAHEAIRPTYMDKTEIEGDRNEKQLYDLIWKRTIASQMADAELEKTNITIQLRNGIKTHFIATGEVVIFDGFLKVYKESYDDEHDDEKAGLLPPINKDDVLNRITIHATEQYTLHPPRYTEASLVKKMEALGIGRPSTYAPTITTIQNRGYIVRESREGIEKEIEQIELKGKDIKTKVSKKIFGAEKKKLFPSDIGMVVTDFLTEHFNNIMDYNFTARAEESLDNIAEGEVQWQSMISQFYNPFHENVEQTLKISERNTGERVLGTDTNGEKVSVRIGRFGPMAQIGEGENVKYAGLLKGQLMETITLEEALELFKFPRKLGVFEDKDVSVGIGRFGPYIKHNNAFVSLKKGEDEPGTITLDTAIQRINEKRESDRNKLIQSFDDGIQILNGRFGPYIAFNKKNFKIPKTKKAEELTHEEALEIISKEDGKKPKTKKTGAKEEKKTTKPKPRAKKA